VSRGRLDTACHPDRTFNTDADHHSTVDRDRLEATLATRFDADEDTAHVVARQARDLADSGRIEADFGYELTAEDVVSHLQDAPDEYGLLQRWNWWLGSLEVTHSGYDQFHARASAGRE